MNKNNISSRHHYLPVFYLKGFSKNGSLKIYDVEKNKFKQNGKDFSPKAFFFEKELNTIDTIDGKNDIIEKFYSNFDSEISILFNKINTAFLENRFNVTEDEMPILNHFVSLMYWRLPHKQRELEAIISNKNLHELGLIITRKDGSMDVENADNLKNHPYFSKMYRLYKPFIDIIESYDCRNNYHILGKHESYPFICSDNPIIFKCNDNQNISSEDYIFPISGTRYLCRGNFVNFTNPALPMMIDLLILKQAVNFVCCSSEIYIDCLNEFYIKHFVSVEHLKSEIFRLMIDSDYLV